VEMHDATLFRMNIFFLSLFFFSLSHGQLI
jgi:hypothetical protein